MMQRQREPRQHSGRRFQDGLALRPRRTLHTGLLVVLLVMICFGLVTMFSASMVYSLSSGPTYYVVRQLIFTVVGLILALLIALFLPVGIFEYPIVGIVAYGVTLLLLLLVKLVGVVENSARRWLQLGPIRIQPSEIAKISVVLILACYVTTIRKWRRAGQYKARTPIGQFFLDGFIDIVRPVLLLLPFVVLILLQPHVSGTFIILCLILLCLLLAGFSPRTWVSALIQGTALLLVVATLFGVVYLSVPSVRASVDQNFQHATRRIDMFTGKIDDPDQTTQIDMALLAIGSGQTFGRGLGEGRMKFNYLPESHNDYIFSIISEELGFVGGLAVILLFLLFLLIGLSIARNAVNSFCTMLAGGYTGLIVIQALLHIAVNTKTIPATGISLPLFSYGGTSQTLFLVGIGILLAVSRSGQRVR